MALQSPTVFSRRRPEELLCPSSRVLRKNVRLPCPSSQCCHRGTEESLAEGWASPTRRQPNPRSDLCLHSKAWEPPRLSSETAFPTWNPTKNQSPVVEFKCMRFNKAAADPTSPSLSSALPTTCLPTRRDVNKNGANWYNEKRIGLRHLSLERGFPIS